MGGGAGETFKSRCLFRLASHHADEDLCVAKIGWDLDTGDGDEANDPGILGWLREECRYLLADRLTDAISATSVARDHYADAVDASVRATCSLR